MNERNKKKLGIKKIVVIIFFTGGTALIILSTYNFSVVIPDIDKDILIVQEELDNMDKAHILQEMYQSQVSIAYENYLLLKEINSTSSYEEKFIRDLELLLASKIYFLHILDEGFPNEEYFKELGNMNLSELNEEQLKYLSLENFPLYIFIQAEKLGRLKEEKQNILNSSTTIQIFGLVINQVAIIIEISFKKSF